MKKNYSLATSTHSERLSDEFGIWFCNNIINREWFASNGTQTPYDLRYNKFALLRSHMTGNVDDQRFKKMLSEYDDDVSALTIDTTFRHIMPKYIKTIIDGMGEEVYDVCVDAVDEIAQTERSKRVNTLRAKMALNATLKKAEEELGYNLSFDGLPDNEEELILQEQIGGKLAREIAMEISTSKVFDANDMRETANKCGEDIVLMGIGAMRNLMDSERGIRIDYVTPENFIYSRSSRGSRTQDGRYYFGEKLCMPISEIKRMSGLKFSDEQYASMCAPKKTSSTFDRSGKYNANYNDEDETADVLHFCFKADKVEVYKRRETSDGVVYKPKAEDWTPEYKTFNKVEDVYETWYEGWWVIGTEFIWDYREMTDLIRPASNIKKALPPYAMYETQTQSIGMRILPHAESLQIINLKTKQLISKAIPNGYAVDVDSLQAFDLGNGMVLSPAQQVKEFFKSGNILFNGKSLDGGTNRPPFYPSNTGMGNDLQQLQNAYLFEIAQIEDITGINKFRDGSTVSSETAVGVQKMAIAMSNNTTKHTLKALLHIVKDTAECVVTRLQDLAQYNELGDGVAALIGYDNAKILSEDKGKFHWMFSTTIKMKPTEEEKAELNELINIALNSKSIDLPDAIDIKQIDNVKLASQMLKAKEKAKIKRLEKLEKEKIALMEAEKRKTQLTMAQAEAIKKNAEMQAMQTEVQTKLQADIMKMANEWKFKFKYQQQEFINDMQLKELEVNGMTGKEGMKESKKDERQREQATMSSKIAEQKQYGLPSQDFTKQQLI